MIRSSGSVAANYIEANEAFSKKDFLYRSKICRKEIKESKLWLDLLDKNDNNFIIKLHEEALTESIELIKIFSRIIDSTAKNLKNEKLNIN